jgi:hypothetical protein
VEGILVGDIPVEEDSMAVGNHRIPLGRSRLRLPPGQAVEEDNTVRKNNNPCLTCL